MRSSTFLLMIIWCAAFQLSCSEAPVLEDKIHLEHFCGRRENRNFIEAREAKKADLERLSKIDPESSADRKIVEELRPAMFEVANAEAIDLATALRDTYGVSSKTGNFSAAYKDYGGVVESIAGRDWKGSKKPFDDTGTLRRVNLALLIDMAIALREAAKSPKNPRLAEAYREGAERIDSLAGRDWKVDDMSLRAESATLNLERDALSKAQSAYSIDIAAMLREASKSHTRGKFAESYKQHVGRIESLAARNWKTEALTKEEEDALCSLLTEINVK
jgi:hypothetical protein